MNREYIGQVETVGDYLVTYQSHEFNYNGHYLESRGKKLEQALYNVAKMYLNDKIYERRKEIILHDPCPGGTSMSVSGCCM